MGIVRILIAGAMAAGLAFGQASSAAAADSTSKEAKRKAGGEYKSEVRKAKAQRKAAVEKCKTLSGNRRDVCVKEAKAAEKKARAEAKARRDAAEGRAEARGEGRQADYRLAREKCDSLSGNAKDACMADAKARYRQN